MSDGGRDATAPTRRRPVALGSLGRAIARPLDRARSIVAIVALLFAFYAGAAVATMVGGRLEDEFGRPVGLAILVLLVVAIVVLAVGAYAIVPPFVLSARDRNLVAVNAWILVRERRRAFGGMTPIVRLPRDARSAETWLAGTLPSDQNPEVRVYALLFAGRFDDARREAALLPEASRLGAFRKLMLQATIEDATGGEVDESDLQAAAEALPAGIARTEAAVSLAMFRARRRLPDEDWRVPLLEVRPLIPASNTRVLLVDYVVPFFLITLRRIVPPAVMVVVLWILVSSLLSLRR
jgi:hypothetical protein